MELDGKNAWMVCRQGESEEDQKQCIAAPVAATGGGRGGSASAAACCSIAPGVPRALGKRRFCLTAKHVQTAKGTSASLCHPS